MDPAGGTFILPNVSVICGALNGSSNLKKLDLSLNSLSHVDVSTQTNIVSKIDELVLSHTDLN